MIKPYPNPPKARSRKPELTRYEAAAMLVDSLKAIRCPDGRGWAYVLSRYGCLSRQVTLNYASLGRKNVMSPDRNVIDKSNDAGVA